ncbi:hypothetical protein AA313_de0209004 [Arthrobotrys entomopaga]|nr:hypothetical protein AA313_de0209004 [Arthrobotrys entomopaga]
MPPKRSRNTTKRAKGAQPGEKKPRTKGGARTSPKPAPAVEQGASTLAGAAPPQAPVAVPCDRVTRSMAARGLGKVSEPPQEASVPSRQPARPRKRNVARESQDSGSQATKPATLERKLRDWEGGFRRGPGIIENSPPLDDEATPAERRERLALRLAAVSAIKKRHGDDSIESLGSISSLSNTPERGSRYIWWMDNLRRSSVLKVETSEESQTWYAFLGDVFWKGKPISEYTTGEAILMRYLVEKEVLIPCAINMGELKTGGRKEGLALREFQICSETTKRKRSEEGEEEDEEDQPSKRVRSTEEDVQGLEAAD